MGDDDDATLDLTQVRATAFNKRCGVLATIGPLGELIQERGAEGELPLSLTVCLVVGGDVLVIVCQKLIECLVVATAANHFRGVIRIRII